MIEFDRIEGESVSLIVGDHVIQIKLLETGQNQARIGIEAPIGTMMFRNERLAKPIQPGEIAATSKVITIQAK